MSQNSENDVFSGTFLSARIDAQLEAYRKIATDYNNIINSLKQVNEEIEDLKKEYHEDSGRLSNEFTKITSSNDASAKEGVEVLQSIRRSLEKQSSAVSKLITNIESYQTNLEKTIKSIIEEASRHGQQDEEECMKNFKIVFTKITTEFLEDLQEERKLIQSGTMGNTETNNLVKVLHEELVRKKNKTRLRIYYVLATAAGIIAIMETLSQLGFLTIRWFPQ